MGRRSGDCDQNTSSQGGSEVEERVRDVAVGTGAHDGYDGTDEVNDQADRRGETDSRNGQACQQAERPDPFDRS